MSFKFGDLFFGDLKLGGQFKLAAGALAALTLFGCISDGPNKTGEEYLSNQGIVLQNPLYHVVLNNFPVDTLWTSDTEPSHLGDSVLLAGKSGDFFAKFRLAFEITDSNFIDSARITKSFKLSLTPHFPGYGIGKAGLVASVGKNGDTAKSKIADTLTFLVETSLNTDLNSTGVKLSEDDRIALFAKLNRPYMARFEDEAVLPASNVQDTIKIQVKGFYDSLQYQINALPHLLDTLLSKPISTKWLIQMQLKPLFKSSDSLTALIRFGGKTAVGLEKNRPSLLFGSATTSTTLAAGQKIQPMTVAGYNGGNFIGVNYKLDYNGSDTNLVTAKNRGWYLQLNRKTLLDSINAALKRQGKAPANPDITGKFDVTYFVPFGQISIPLDSSKYFENNFPLDLRLSSDLDSILPASPEGAFTSDIVPLDSTTILMSSISDQTDANQLETISISYFKAEKSDSTHRKIIIHFAKDSTNADTTYIKINETKNIGKFWTKDYGRYATVTNGAPVIVSVMALDNSLFVQVNINSHSRTEPNGMRDPETGAPLTTLASRIPHFLQANQDTLNLRATYGLQSLLNRTDMGKQVFSDLFVQPLLQSAIDTTFTYNGKTGPEYVPFPVLSVIPPKLKDRKLFIRVDLYLYPLKKDL